MCTSWAYDFAILHWRQPLPWQAEVRPVCLPTGPPAIWDTVTAVGWGKVGNGNPLPNFFLKEVNQQVLILPCERTLKKTAL